MNRMPAALWGILLAAAVLSPVTAQDHRKTSAEMQREAVESKLHTMAIDVDFQDQTLTQAIDYFREYTGLSWIIDPEVGEPSDTITLKLKGIKVGSALKIILKQLDLAALVKDGILVITTKDQVNTYVVTRVYDVRDLFIKINHFPGPRLELLPGFRAGGNPGVSFTLEEPSEPALDQSTVEDIIRSTTGGTSWDDNENAQITMTPNGLLMITQSKKVHEEVERLLQALRWFK